MKNTGIHPLLLGTLLFVAFTAGVFWGRLSPLQGDTIAPQRQTVSNAPQEQEAESGKININTATEQDLMLLPGIGPALAQRIIEYRETKGIFEAPEDLMLIKGIGTATYEKLSQYITIGGYYENFSS